MTFTPYVDVCEGTNTSLARFFVAALGIACRKVPSQQKLIYVTSKLGGFETLNSLKLGILNT